MNRETLFRNDFERYAVSPFFSSGGASRDRFEESGLPFHFETPEDISVLRVALLNPYFPRKALLQTHFRADHPGGKLPPHRWERNLKRRLLQFSRIFLRIWSDLPAFGLDRITAVPLDGRTNHPFPEDQWCSLCGLCCHLGGVVPDPPPTVRYPGYWYTYLSGDAPMVQEFCPFLFQYFDRDILFCAIHNIKPRSCLRYGEEDCRRNHPGAAR